MFRFSFNASLLGLLVLGLLACESWPIAFDLDDTSWKDCSRSSASVRACIQASRDKYDYNRVVALGVRADREGILAREDRAWVWITIGESYKRDGDFPSSRKAFSKAVDICKKDPEAAGQFLFRAFNNLCRIYGYEGNFTKSGECFEEGNRIFPQDAIWREGLDEAKTEAFPPRESGRTHVVFRYRPTAPIKSAPLLKGSWNAAGIHDVFDAWAPVEMRKIVNSDGEFWMVSVPLDPASDLPFIAFAELPGADSAAPQVLAETVFRVQGPEARFVTLEPAQFRESGRAPVKVRPPDGKRRVLAVWPDSGTWLYLMALAKSHQVPAIEELMESGVYGVMDSGPPVTSLVTDKMTTFDSERFSWGKPLSLLLKQIKGIGFFDRLVPAGAIRFLSGASPKSDLWNHLRSNGKTSANLIYSDIWCNSRDERSEDTLKRLGLPSEEDVLAGLRGGIEENEFIRSVFPDPSQVLDQRRDFVRWIWEDMAIKTTIAREAWRKGDFDFLMVRFAAVDLVHHYDSLVLGSNRDALSLLNSVYRALDREVRALRGELDADDVFILLSDHGSKDRLLHHRDAIFVASGGGIPPKGYIGREDIRVLPFLISGLLGVPPPAGIKPLSWPGFTFTP
jgi:hypothetical protein